VIEIGQMNKLTVQSKTDGGLFLGDLESNEDVFMPYNLAAPALTVGQELEAFVYLDTRGITVATTSRPHAVVGEFALMTVIDAQEFGAFFDWGIKKDLLVPGNEQKIDVREDENYIVRVCLEEGTDRVYGTTKLGEYIENAKFDIEEGSKVSVVPVERSELGYRSIVNKKFIGMLYHNEIYKNIIMGQEYEGIVKKIRMDGLVDVSLQKLGIRNVVESKDVIIQMLEQNGGKSPLHDKSSPESIKRELGMSKKTFKNAIGMLYKQRKILISKDGIELVKK
jgi:uncharacterized protein